MCGCQQGLPEEATLAMKLKCGEAGSHAGHLCLGRSGGVRNGRQAGAEGLVGGLQGGWLSSCSLQGSALAVQAANCWKVVSQD